MTKQLSGLRYKTNTTHVRLLVLLLFLLSWVNLPSMDEWMHECAGDHGVCPCMVQPWPASNVRLLHGIYTAAAAVDYIWYVGWYFNLFSPHNTHIRHHACWTRPKNEKFIKIIPTGSSTVLRLPYASSHGPNVRIRVWTELFSGFGTSPTTPITRSMHGHIITINNILCVRTRVQKDPALPTGGASVTRVIGWFT